MKCLWTTVGIVALLLSSAGAFAAAEVPRIDSVGLLAPQPHQSDPAVIWYDNFDDEGKLASYFEKSGPLVDRQFFGLSGTSMECFYAKGQKGTGGRKFAFGDSPVGRPVKRGQQFTDVYWRIYVKHQWGWTGGAPAKMSRAMIMNGSNWSQAMISHVWSGLTLDPVRAAQGTRCTTTKYNDWDRLKWLQNSPGSQFKISATEESGRWVCVEAQARLNTPGRSDGYNCLWIDGIKQCERTNLDFRSSYTKKGINCIFLEAYWNNGSPVDQYRWYDDFVVSTDYIGPAHTPLNPVLVKTPFRGRGTQKEWEVEVAVRQDGGSVLINRSERASVRKDAVIGEDIQGEVVWKSNTIEGEGLQVTVGAETGSFVGPRAGKSSLAPRKLHFCRVRQQGADGRWSEWSNWHQGFQTGDLEQP